MNKYVYDVSVLVGLGLITAGVYGLYGLSAASIVAGSLILCMTVFNAVLASK